MRSFLLTALLAGSLLAYVGAHVALCVGLVRGSPRWRALLAFVIPPLAPLWGWKAGMRARVYAWTAAVGLYALGVLFASL